MLGLARSDSGFRATSLDVGAILNPLHQLSKPDALPASGKGPTCRSGGTTRISHGDQIHE